MRKYLLVVISLYSFLLLSGCGSNEVTRVNNFSGGPEIFSMVTSEAEFSTSGDTREKYLAYTHDLRVRIPATDLPQMFEQLKTTCAEDIQNKCTMLSANINTDYELRASITVRINPAGAQTLLKETAEMGEVTYSNTSVVDLQDAIVDNEKRVEMLKHYEARLLALEVKASTDVNSLIQIADQLSQTQSDIEFAAGEKARLSQRVQMDIVEIGLISSKETTFLGPISDAFGSFGDNLSDGISNAITAVAFIIPWLFIVYFLLFLVRKLWLSWKRKVE